MVKWSNMTVEAIIEALSKAPKDYKVYQDSGWECGDANLSGVVLDANMGEVIFVNNSTVKKYLELPERYKMLGHGKDGFEFDYFG